MHTAPGKLLRTRQAHDPVAPQVTEVGDEGDIEQQDIVGDDAGGGARQEAEAAINELVDIVNSYIRDAADALSDANAWIEDANDRIRDWNGGHPGADLEEIAWLDTPDEIDRVDLDD